MGIFDKLRKEKDKKIEESKQMQYSMRTQNGNEAILVYNIKKQGNIKYTNGDIMQLIMARITKFHEDQRIYYDMSDFIAFEIPMVQDINKELMQAVMKQYDKEETAKQSSKGLNSYYLGRTTKNKEGYVFDRKSVVGEKIVGKLVEKQINQKMQSMGKNEHIYQAKNDEAFRSQIENGANKANDYVEYMKKIRQNRKDHPYMAEKNFAINGKLYVNYDGINVNTGDILRLRKVNKVGKDGSGTYLYSAYISNTPNDYDAEIFDESGTPNGFYVCFELQKRLGDIVKDGNREEVIKVLQLLSNERNFHNLDKLSYIGEIDKKGQINRREASSSNAIRMKIEEMKKEYDSQMKQQSK